jgi:hypothetical protein
MHKTDIEHAYIQDLFNNLCEVSKKFFTVLNDVSVNYRRHKLYRIVLDETPFLL